ncbi:putative integral membrane protein [Leptolyngbyaceae cyanobacterium JSC-12]|nr:putative integral membrane protein [Leptolyngbyaceae cyanobacterium JSC-12]
MNKVMTILLGSAAVAMGLAGNIAFISPPVPSAAPIGGGLGFCNRSKQGKLYVAIAYPVEDNQWKTQGWLQLNEGECDTIIQGTLTNRYYYYLAESDNGHSWKGTHKFCVSDTSFVFAVADKECQGTAVRWAGFRELDTGKNARNFMLNLE